MEETDENPWHIEVNGKQITPEVNYKGHTILNNQVILKYELAYQGQKILVEEKPEFLR
jgi:cytochrome c